MTKKGPFFGPHNVRKSRRAKRGLPSRKLILSKWWEHTAKTLGEEFNLAGSIWWGEATTLWVWTMRCIGIVRTMAIFGHLICPRDLWWDVSVLWGQYLHHRHRDLWIIHLILWCAFYRSWEDFGYLYKDDTVSRRLWSTLWISYYCSCSCRTLVLCTTMLKSFSDLVF